jgi:Ca-activated chloride channel family protein
LIGYENRLLQQEDFLNDKVDAGEIGAGHTVTALYEITPVGSDAVMIPGGRYAQEAATVVGGNSGELAFVKIRYKLPGEAVSSELDLAVRSNGVEAPGQQPSDNIRFAAAVAGFGELMRGGKYTGDWQYADVLQLARQSRGNDDHGYRSELLTLVQLASTLD